MFYVCYLFVCKITSLNLYIKSRIWSWSLTQRYSKAYKCSNFTTGYWKQWELEGIGENLPECSIDIRLPARESTGGRKECFGFHLRETVTRIRGIQSLAYQQDFSKIFRKIARGCLFCSRAGGSPSPYWYCQSEHSPQCWQQQIRKVNIRQLLQSVLSPQSVWITINKTWNAFKNSIAKSLVSSWSLLILIKGADLEEMAFSSRSTL